jgi:CHAD domain-containing protein
VNTNGAGPGPSSHGNAISDKKVRRAFTRRTDKLWRRLRKDHSQVLRNCSASSIHDLRVTTRRLQTLVDVASISTPNRRAAKLRKRLRRLRHILGRRRDLDVSLDKLKQRAGKTASARRRRILRALIRMMTPEVKQVTQEMHRATKKTDIKKLGRLTYKTIGRGHIKDLSVGVVDAAIQQAERKWVESIDTAKARKDPADFHDVRIKTKTLRYMIELRSHLVENSDSEAATEWLKVVQDDLGDWHDEMEVSRRVTALLSKDLEYQANDAATALIQSLRDRAKAYTQFSTELVMSLRDTWTKLKNAAPPFAEAARQPRLGNNLRSAGRA